MSRQAIPAIRAAAEATMAGEMVRFSVLQGDPTAIVWRSGNRDPWVVCRGSRQEMLERLELTEMLHFNVVEARMGHLAMPLTAAGRAIQ